MPSGGSIQSMITTLHNNKKLLRKRRIHDSKFGFAMLRDKYRTYSTGSVDSKPLSKEELLKIRTKIINDRRKERIWDFIQVYLLIAIIISIPIYTYKGLQEYQVESTKIRTAEKTKQYLFYLQDGDKWLKEGRYHNAVFQYSLAKKIYPKEYDINYRLALAYGRWCQEELSGCEEGQTILEELKKQFPSRQEIRDLEGLYSEQLRFN